MAALALVWINMCVGLLSGLFLKGFDTSLDGFEVVVHLKTCIDGVESVEAVVEVCTVHVLTLGIEIVDISNSAVEVRDGLAEEVLAFVVELFVESGLIIGGNIVGLCQFVDSAVVEHLTKTEVGEELVGQSLEGLFVASLGTDKVVDTLEYGTGSGQKAGVELGFVDGEVKSLLDFGVALFQIAFQQIGFGHHHVGVVVVLGGFGVVLGHFDGFVGVAS